MKFKSALVTQVSGSVGGMTGARNRSGMYFRARSMPVNPQTSFQTAIRNAFTQCVTAWGDLTPDQRENWQVYAANVPWTNTLGDSIRLTGNQMFTSCNTPILQIGNPIILDAPTLFNAPAIALPVLSQAAGTPFAVSFAFDNTDLETFDSVIIYASIARSPSINFFKGPYRFNNSTGGGVATQVLIPNPTWVEGQKIFVQCRISYGDGRLSPIWRGDMILTHTPV